MEGSGLEQTVGTTGGDRPRLGEETVATPHLTHQLPPSAGRAR